MGNSNSVQTQAQPQQECKACSACPETRQLRDECIIFNGEEQCKKEIENHKVCLKKYGFE
ncbi:unnamed protein product (macronuclear) [Paramecium tetraurelia]|uniref:Cytochrome c oxidase copper chaperone n=1 Tax=Paramecium tetraurelia TaxID=5888 RepID=A0D9G5_PARTE|nr:uncharacterized protein GSPATT00014612001 [Paramecium tetraurelia]CAK79682.1 unnamed protein product [Paramecium tetraurelia]|eukprot:XP_001447079.1 hypothetical protein (macronuclear) [Paramecium tetraurelia strain d4-2]